jgi:hypothetical protein
MLNKSDLASPLDRFDPGGDSLNNSYSLSPGDLAVPFQVSPHLLFYNL